MKKKHTPEYEALAYRLDGFDTTLRGFQAEIESDEFKALPNYEQTELVGDLLAILSDHLVGARIKYKKIGGNI